MHWLLLLYPYQTAKNQGEWMLISAGPHSVPFSLLIEGVSISLNSTSLTSTNNITEIDSSNSNINANTIWTIDDSPYLIQSDVIIEEGITLTIEPGVTLLFDGFYSFFVSGNIVAIGNENNPITFKMNESATDDYWGIININSTIPSQFEWCSFDHATKAVMIRGSHNNVFKYVTIENAKETGVSIHEGTALFDHCFITKSGLDGMYLDVASDSEIKNTVISQNGRNGVEIFRFGRVNFHDSSIINNGQSGFYLTISGESQTIINCNIFNNGNFDIQHGGNVLINARQNYWGADTTQEMQNKGTSANIDKIYDYYDNSNHGRVFYEEFLLSPVEINIEIPLPPPTSTPIPTSTPTIPHPSTITPSPTNTSINDFNVIIAFNENNNHYYGLLDAPDIWTEAKQLAESLGGYLATITSEDEGNFLLSSFAWENLGLSWLGGFQDPNIEENTPEDAAIGWQWVTGEPWEYTNWGSERPNNLHVDQDYLHYLEYQYGKWDDCENERLDTVKFCLVEWDNEPLINHTIKSNPSLPPSLRTPTLTPTPSSTATPTYLPVPTATVDDTIVPSPIPPPANINTQENFPDPNFRKAVEEFIGVEPGGYFTIQDAESKQEKFDISDKQITSIEGIEFLKNITEFHFSHNNITHADLSNNTKLKTILAEWTNLQTINIKNIHYIDWLWLWHNNIASLDLSDLEDVTHMHIGHNPISSIDVTRFNSLIYLMISETNIDSIDISNSANLSDFGFSSTKIREIDLSNNIDLKRLVCKNNDLRFLDVSNNVNLEVLDIEGNLIEEIDLTNNNSIVGLNISNNLFDYDDWDFIEEYKTRLGSPTYLDWGGLKSGFIYSPQKNYDPFDINITETPAIVPTSSPTITPTPISESTSSKIGNNLIINGSFEIPVIETTLKTMYPEDTLEGWVVEYGSVDLKRDYWQHAKGEQSLDLNGLEPGAISQVIDTIIGKTYTLIFALAGNPDPATETIKKLQVNWNEKVVDIIEFEVSEHTVEDMGWKYYAYEVIANTEKSELTFISLSGFSESSDSNNQSSFKTTILVPENRGRGPALDDIQLYLSPDRITIPFDLPEGAKPLKMVKIPNGIFMMGSPEDEQPRKNDEGPQHQVKISNYFYMGQYEITQAQWEAVMGNNPSEFHGNPNHPVENVSWNDCQHFIQKLNELGIGEFRLPTEAEWEYACRAGSQTRFYWGEDPDLSQIDNYGWHSDNSNNTTHEVGMKLPNSLGLYDICGNVYEWCEDYYGQYSEEPQVDPFVRTGTVCSKRGVAWNSSKELGFRSAYRQRNSKDTSNNNTGLRIVKLIETETINVSLPNLPEGAKPLTMVKVPSGSFTMGSPSNEEDRDSNEGPQHQVTITKDLYLGKYEVTQAQWQAVMGNNPARSYGVGNDNPVYYVSWNDCQEFIQRLNGMNQGTFRLPTEAEWEYACRAGTTTRFYWGDDQNNTEIDDYAWYTGNNSPSGTKEVGLKLPNAWGLFDMSGNVYEWCQDQYGSYSSNAQIDPTGPTGGSYRVDRGGDWRSYARYCRSAFRAHGSSGYSSRLLGFRIARNAIDDNNEHTPTPTIGDDISPTPTTLQESNLETIIVPLSLPPDAKPLTMVKIPSGTFIMGSPEDELGRHNGREWLPHEVTITHDFYIDKYEITQAQYQAVTDTNPSAIKVNINNPVDSVTWYQSALFCNILSEMNELEPVYNESDWSINWEANGFRLPTDAEWEYACRAGTTTRYSFGDALECKDIENNEYCFLFDQYMWWLGNQTQNRPVGSKLPNPFGLFDMHGNVYEWCNDFWEAPYVKSSQTDPIGPEAGSNRVLRGGHWRGRSEYCRTAFRHSSEPDTQNNIFGFRIVKVIDELDATPTNTYTPTITPTVSNIITPTPSTPSSDNFTIGGSELFARPGTTISIPVEITQLPESTEITFHIEFDNTLLTWNQEINPEGTLIANWGLKDANLIEDNKLVVSGIAISSPPISGNGVLVRIPFNVSSDIDSTTTTALKLTNLKDGLVGAEARDILLTIPIGMIGDVNQDGEITASDAQLAFEFVLGRKTPSDIEFFNAEVTGDGEITAADAQKIFEVVLGRSTFSKSSRIKSEKLSYQPSGTSMLTVETVSGNPGEQVIVPVILDQGSDITSMTIDFAFDLTKLSFVGINKTDTLVENFLLADANESSPGVIRFAAAAVTAPAISTSGTLIQLIFDVKSTANGNAAISITSLKDDVAGVPTTAGAIQISDGGVLSTLTPTPISVISSPTPTPTPVQTQEQQVFIYDNAGDTTGDLTGSTDFDTVDNRNITIAWSAEQGDATDWHVYVRKGFGGMKYLGRTAVGTATSFDWYSGAANLDSDFANGPDFNSAYTFRVVRIDDKRGPDDYFDMSVPVGFNLEGGNTVSLAQPELPNLNPGQVAIYDDILGGNDLAPMGSTGSDSDKSSSRAIQIAWNFGRAASEINEFHIMVSVDGGDFDFLGQTYTSGLNYFWWTPNRPFRTNPVYEDGPQDGHIYQFMVVLSPLSGARASLKSGILEYSVVD